MASHLPGWLVCAWLAWPVVLLGQAKAKLEVDFRTAPRETTYSRYLGSVGNGRFGVPVCGGHDCDGDGLPDVAFASVVGNTLSRTGAGNITLVWGRGEAFGESLDTEGVDGERVLHIAGAQALEACGAEIWMDDVDGDGLGDLLIGRQNHSPTAARRGAGALTVIFGGPELRQLTRDRRILDLLEPPAEIRRLDVLGAGAYDRLGIWMRTGDLDGDGIADIAVGADEVDAPNELNRGEVIVLRGGPQWRDVPVVDLAVEDPMDLPQDVIRVVPPPVSINAHFGATLHIGDLDGNGNAELVVAATLDRAGAAVRLPNAPAATGLAVGGTGRGTVYILWDELFAPEVWRSGAEIRLSGVDAGVSMLSGGLRNLRFGEELIAGGDYDGDGRPDLFVGDLKGSSRNGVAAGLGYVFFTAEGLRNRGLNVGALPRDVRHTVLEGVFAGALSADAAAFADLDEDGHDDLVLCSPHENPLRRVSAGSLHVIYGQREGWPEEINLAANGLPESVRLVHLIGARGSTLTDVGDTLGYSLALGDANGDGTPDILTNEMQGNGSQRLDVGNMILFSGRALLPPPNAVSQSSLNLQVLNEGSVSFRWQSQWRQRYWVQRSVDLEQWETVSDELLGTGEVLEFLDEGVRLEREVSHYRLESESVVEEE